MAYSKKTKTLMQLQAYVERRRTLDQKIRETILVARSTDLDGVPLCTLKEIGDAIGVSKQAIWQYVEK